MYWQRPNNPDKKWFSPCILYSDWIWQDKKGRLFSYEECISSSENSENFYKNRANVLVCATEIEPTSPFNKIPNSYKKYIKKYLSYLFPMYIGNDPSDFI